MHNRRSLSSERFDYSCSKKDALIILRNNPGSTSENECLSFSDFLPNAQPSVQWDQKLKNVDVVMYTIFLVHPDLNVSFPILFLHLVMKHLYGH